MTVESVRESVKTIRLPSALEEPVVQSLITKCHDKYGSKLNPTESQCRSYSEYAFCIQNCIADLIDSEVCIKMESCFTFYIIIRNVYMVTNCLTLQYCIKDERKH